MLNDADMSKGVTLSLQSLNTETLDKIKRSNINSDSFRELISEYRKGTAVLAVGSPGADRITTALQQFLINHLLFEMPLEDAIAHPRVHVDTSGEDVRLMAEPGLDLPDIDLTVNEFPDLTMYFGGVVAAVYDSATGLDSSADPRREGGTCIYEH